jgi:hypothetical protein
VASKAVKPTKPVARPVGKKAVAKNGSTPVSIPVEVSNAVLGNPDRVEDAGMALVPA